MQEKSRDRAAATSLYTNQGTWSVLRHLPFYFCLRGLTRLHSNYRPSGLMTSDHRLMIKLNGQDSSAPSLSL